MKERASRRKKPSAWPRKWSTKQGAVVAVALGPDRAVLVDADCLIAGTLTATGATSELLDRWEDGEFELIVCPQLLDEVRGLLLHPRVAGKYSIPKEEVERFLMRLADEALMFDDPEDPPRVVPDDPGDDYLVALAKAAGAEALVTRDRHFEKVKIKGIPILSPREFLRSLNFLAG